MEIKQTNNPLPEAAEITGHFSNRLRALAAGFSIALAGIGLAGCGSQEKVTDSGSGAETTKSGPTFDDISSNTQKGVKAAQTAANIFKRW